MMITALFTLIACRNRNCREDSSADAKNQNQNRTMVFPVYFHRIRKKVKPEFSPDIHHEIPCSPPIVPLWHTL
jgi:hypothetical protein